MAEFRAEDESNFSESLCWFLLLFLLPSAVCSGHNESVVVGFSTLVIMIKEGRVNVSCQCPCVALISRCKVVVCSGGGCWR